VKEEEEDVHKHKDHVEEQGVSHDTRGRGQLLNSCLRTLFLMLGELFDFFLYNRDDNVSWSGHSFLKQVLTFSSLICEA